MGEAKRSKLRFYIEHPDCCFCAGEASSETQDHWPPRSIFRERDWPKGHVFPACSRCNGHSSTAETTFAILSKMTRENLSGHDERILSNQMKAFSEIHPEVFTSMLRLTRHDRKRLIASQYERFLQGVSSEDVFPLSLDDPHFDHVLTVCGTKLFCALFYKHMGYPLPRSGGIVMKWLFNGDWGPIKNVMPALEDIFKRIKPEVLRSQANKIVTDQFEYRWAQIDEEGAAFVVTFGGALLLFAMVREDKTKFSTSSNTIFTPFSLAKELT